MQKVMIILKMTIKNSYFVSRMVVFNEIFASLQKIGKIYVYCVLWNESVSGRRSSAVTSTYLNIIKISDPSVNNFIFWADNCAGQNKNWLLFSTFVWIVNQKWGADVL